MIFCSRCAHVAYERNPCLPVGREPPSSARKADIIAITCRPYLRVRGAKADTTPACTRDKPSAVAKVMADKPVFLSWAIFSLKGVLHGRVMRDPLIRTFFSMSTFADYFFSCVL